MRRFVLSHSEARRRAVEAIREAPDGHEVRVSEPRRSLDANARLHAMLTEIAQTMTYQGKRLPMECWKALFVSAHSIATKQGGEVMVGMEGEFVAIRESTATMSKARASSLMEYIEAWRASQERDA